MLYDQLNTERLYMLKRQRPSLINDARFVPNAVRIGKMDLTDTNSLGLDELSMNLFGQLKTGQQNSENLFNQSFSDSFLPANRNLYNVLDRYYRLGI